MRIKRSKVLRVCEHCGARFLVYPCEARARFCSRVCRYQAPLPRRPIEERFWSKVDTSGECWLWMAGKGKAGYGIFHPAAGQSVFAHRFAWELLHGSIPKGMEVCHDCPGGDNPACIRHLFLATHAENMADMSRKGRAATGDRHGMRLYPEKHARGPRRKHA